MKISACLPLCILLACKPPQPIATPTWEQRVEEASRTAWSALPAAADPERARADYLAGFKDGACMVDNALRDGRVPFMPKSGLAGPAPIPVGGLPPGASVLVEGALRPEVDAATGFPIHAAFREQGAPFARGQEAGFAWAVERHRAELTRRGLLVPRPLPDKPCNWQPWPVGETRMRLGRDGLDVGVYAGAGLLAWESRSRGFPPRRAWRPGTEPRRLGLAPDALWVEYQDGQVAALDLATGHIRDTCASLADLGGIPEGEGDREPKLQWERAKAEMRAEDDARLEQLKPLLEQGDVHAMVATGRLLASRTPEERRRALDLFRQAAAKGSAEGLFETGLCHYHGIGTVADRQEAQRWLRQAQEMGHPAAGLLLEQLFRDERENGSRFLGSGLGPTGG